MQHHPALAAFFGAMAAQAGGDGGQPLLQAAAALSPAPAVPPTAKQILDKAAAGHRQALKVKQDLERRQGHLDNRRSELQLQMDKVETEFKKCAEELAGAEAEVKAKQQELEQARTAAKEAEEGKDKEHDKGRDKDNEDDKGKEMEVESPAAFDPVAFAQQFMADMGDVFATKPPEGPAKEGDQAAEGEEGNPNGKDKAKEDADDTPEAKRTKLSDALAEGIQKGIEAQKRHYEEEMARLKSTLGGFGGFRPAPAPGVAASSSFRAAPYPAGRQG